MYGQVINRISPGVSDSYGNYLKRQYRDENAKIGKDCVVHKAIISRGRIGDVVVSIGDRLILN